MLLVKRHVNIQGGIVFLTCIQPNASDTCIQEVLALNVDWGR